MELASIQSKGKLMTVEIPSDFANWLLEYFYQKPMNEAEPVVTSLRQLIAASRAKAEAPVQE